MMTVEDPIEYALDGVAQTQVNPRVDLTFARALRAILRQDPDVVMIGEIRDLETAQIACRRRSPATSCSRRCTPTTRRAR
jgi:general secretion pathway protein E